MKRITFGRVLFCNVKQCFTGGNSILHDQSKVFIFVSIAPRSNSHIGSTNTRNIDGYGCNLKVQ